MYFSAGECKTIRKLVIDATRSAETTVDEYNTEDAAWFYIPVELKQQVHFAPLTLRYEAEAAIEDFLVLYVKENKQTWSVKTSIVIDGPGNEEGLPLPAFEVSYHRRMTSGRNIGYVHHIEFGYQVPAGVDHEAFVSEQIHLNITTKYLGYV
jgi:hypothetical protein